MVAGEAMGSVRAAAVEESAVGDLRGSGCYLEIVRPRGNGSQVESS